MNQFVAPWTTPIVLWGRWSQRRACRNAMAASSELTDARRERSEVEEYVVGTLARRHLVAPEHPDVTTGVGASAAGR